MVVLLVTDNIDVFIETILCKTLFCRSEVLGHIHGSTVTTEKKLSVKTVSSKVAPYGAILLSLEDTIFKSLLHECLTEKISLRFIIRSVEANSEVIVCLVEALIYPAVHGLPKFHHLCITVLPFEEHFLSSLERRSVLLRIFL